MQYPMCQKADLYGHHQSSKLNPKRLKIACHIVGITSQDSEQWRDPPFLLHIQHHFTTMMCPRLLRFSKVSFPSAAILAKKAALKGALSLQVGFCGKLFCHGDLVHCSMTWLDSPLSPMHSCASPLPCPIFKREYNLGLNCLLLVRME